MVHEYEVDGNSACLSTGFTHRNLKCASVQASSTHFTRLKANFFALYSVTKSQLDLGLGFDRVVPQKIYKLFKHY